MDSPFRIRPVTAARWPDVEALFVAKGAPSYCWCMVFRAVGEELKRSDRKSRKGFLRKRVKAGIPVGLLAYEAGKPVGWCSVAPKTTFHRLDSVDKLEPAAPPERTWSITCFFVLRAVRGRGLLPLLLDAAVDLARKKKAAILEAYPVDEDSPSYRFMGFVPAFEARGFSEAGRAGTRRHVMRLALSHRSKRRKP